MSTGKESFSDRQPTRDFRRMPTSTKRKQLSIAFRADGGDAVGLGHLSRCVSLARAILKAAPGALISFWCRDTSAAQNFIANEGFEFNPIELPENEELTLGGIMAARPDILVLDIAEHVPHRAFKGWTEVDRSYTKNFCACAPIIIHLDDFAIGNFCGRLVVNGGIVDEYTKYTGKVGGELLVGPKYTLLRPEFDGNDQTRRKTFNRDLSKLLIVDCGHSFTESIPDLLQALQSACASPEVTIVSPRLSSDNKLIAPPLKAKYFPAIKDMAAAMRAADAAVTGGGTILYELAATGTPAISIPAVEHQIRISEKFEQIGLVINAGPSPSASAVKSCVKRLLDPIARKSMSESGPLIVDGRGADRVAKKLLEIATGRGV